MRTSLLGMWGAEEETKLQGAWGGQVHLAPGRPGPGCSRAGSGFGQEAGSHLTRVPGRLLAPVPHMCHVSILPTRRRGRQDAV